MANEKQVKDFQIGLGPSEGTFQNFKQLSDTLGTIYSQLTQVKGAIAAIQGSGGISLQSKDSTLAAELAGMQKELRTLLGQIRSGGPNTQLNQSLLAGQQTQLRYQDKNLDLESNAQLNAYYERRIALQKQANLTQEAAKQYATDEIGMTREIATLTQQVALAQERLTRARVEDNRAAADAATREIRAGRDRVSQLKEELDLRERGARLRVGRALDTGGDATAATAQLAAIQQGKAELADASRTANSAVRLAEAAAQRAVNQTQAPVNTAHGAALREDRTRYVQANQAAGNVGPTRDDMQRLQDRFNAQQQKEAEAEQAALERLAAAHGPDRATVLKMRDRVENAQQQADAKEQAALERLAAAQGPNRAMIYKLRDASTAQDQKAAQQEQDALNKQGSKYGPTRDNLYAARDRAAAKQQRDDAAEQARLEKEASQHGPDRARLYALRDQLWQQDSKEADNFEKMLRRAQIEDQKWEQDRLKQQGASDDDAATRRRRYNQVHGDGGAALALTQTGLTANYMLTQGISNAFQAAISFQVQYEEALAHLKTIAEATDGQMANLTGTIEGVSNATRYGAVDLTKAAAALSEVGVSSSQIGTALRGVADLATATGEDFNKTVDTVTGALGAFKLSANDSVQVTNMIAQAVNSSRLTMDKLKNSIETTGETASEAGVSFKELLAANVAITNTGTASGATLGGGLRQLLTDLEKPSAQFKNILAQVGLTEDDINVKTQGLYGAMRNLHDAGFTAADAMQSFDTRSAAAFTALSGNLNEMSRFEDSLNNTDAATRANADQMNTLGAQYDRFRNQTSLLVGEGFTPLLSGFKDMLKVTSDFEGELRNMSGVVETVGTVLGGVALAGAGKYIGSLVGGLGGMAVGGFEAAAGAAAAGGAIGLYVGAAAAAVAGIAYLVSKLNDSNKAYDDQRTALNKARDAQKDSMESYDSLGRQIDTLRNKMVALNEHPDLLRREIDDVAKTFEKFGAQLDTSAIKKTEDLIDALKRLRGQMNEKYELNTNIVATQLGLMLEQTRKKLNEAPGDFTRATAGGPQELVTQAQEHRIIANGDSLSDLAGDITTLPNGKRSRGALPTGGVMRGNLDSVVAFMQDLTDPQSAAALRGGFLQALGANGQPQNAADVDKALGLIDSANGALNAGRISALARANDPNATALMKTQGAGIDQELGNYQTALKGAREVLETMRTTFSGIDKNAGERAQLTYDKNPGVAARGAKVDEFLQNATRVLNSGSGTTLDNLWYAQTMAESGRQQFGKDGQPLRSSKGAVGVAQVLESTGPEAAAAAGVDWDRDKWLNDPAYNEQIGKAYMGKMLRKYGNNSTLSLAAYNWGQGNVDKLLGANNGANDFRNPAVSMTESDFIKLLPTDTQKYISQIAPGGANVGSLGQFYRLQNNRDMSNATMQTAQLVSQLEDARKQAQDAGNKQEEANVTKLLDKAKEQLAEFERKYNDARKQATPALRQVSQADQRALEAQLGLTNKQLNQSTDVDEIQSKGDQAKSLIAAKYADQINLLKTTSDKLGGEYSAEVVQQIQSLERERDAKLKEEDEAVKHHLEVVSETIANHDLKERLRRDDRAFADFMAGLKNNEKTVLNDGKIEQRNNGQTVRDDQSALAYMNDPRYSAQFSSVQRQSLSFKQADDQDALNRANLATLSRMSMAIEANLSSARGRQSALSPRIADLQARSDSLGDDEQSRNEKTRVEKELNDLLSQRTALDTQITTIEGDQKKNAEDRLELEGKINAKKGTPDSLMDGIQQANSNFLKTHDATASAIDGYNNMITTTQGNLESFFDSVLTGSKSAGAAFRDFAVSFLKSILQIMEQQAALQIVKGIFGAIGAAWGGSGAAAGSATTGVDGLADSGTAFAIQGGVVSAGGTVTRSGTMKRYVGGGIVPGGNGTRDSVHTLLEPGEGVLNQDAVAAVGEDFINGLNSQGNRVVSKSTPAPTPQRPKQPDHVNVWVVAPNQQPQLGPRDIVATISDDIMRGGTTKQLIRQVAMGQS